MNRIETDQPLEYFADEVEEALWIVVTKDFPGPALTIKGRPKSKRFSDRMDRMTTLPDISLECNYNTGGALFTGIDNIDVGRVCVQESNGPAMVFQSMRQCDIKSLRAHRCKSKTDIVRFDAVNNKSDASNMINIGQINCMGCFAPTTVMMEGTAKSPVRHITISQLNMHSTWAQMREQFPETRTFVPGPKTLLQLSQSVCVTINAANFRFDPQDPLNSICAVECGSRSRGCKILNGQMLVDELILDLTPYITGPVQVFPLSV
jgi:hypothetical protein